MIDYVIGHEPIISDDPIIASSDLSGDGRWHIGHTAQMETIGERVKAARKERGMTQGELGKALGVVQSVVSDIENGKLKSWPTHRNAIRRVLGKPLSYFEPEESDLPPETDVHADLSNVVMLPEYDVRLSAGDGFYVGAETTKREWPYPRFLVVDQLGMSPGNATVQEVIGDSMEPTLSSGDYVLIDLNDSRIGLPGIFAVWDGDALVCKRVERIPGSEPRQVRLKSDNPLHGEYQVAEEQVRVVGRVRWITRRA
ncbi:S24 family peptidase [Brevundimonas sp. CEF1]|uniref:S24 family peptidase n=1 Tax=Brevundimonas sp. CEF1 TaxID=3442642 RepID=UPI003F5106A7